MQSATDEIYTLAGHELALTRLLETGGSATSIGESATAASLARGPRLDPIGDSGLWRLPALDLRLAHDQPARVNETARRARLASLSRRERE